VISERCDPGEFVRSAAGWPRLRLEAELERELERASLACHRALLQRRGVPPVGCAAYMNFLKRLRDWLRTGRAPRSLRREPRELMAVVGQALAERGQLDPTLLLTLKTWKEKARRPVAH
jgi:hypothetical protein